MRRPGLLGFDQCPGARLRFYSTIRPGNRVFPERIWWPGCTCPGHLFLTPDDAPAKPCRSFWRFVRRCRARVAHGQSRRPLARRPAQARRAALDVEAMDLLSARL